MYSIAVVRTESPEMQIRVHDLDFQVVMEGQLIAGEIMSPKKAFTLFNQVVEAIFTPKDAFKSVGEQVPVTVIIDLESEAHGREGTLHLELRKGDDVPMCVLHLLTTVEATASNVTMYAVSDADEVEAEPPRFFPGDGGLGGLH